MRLIVLDAGPLGFASNPFARPIAEACRAWLESLLVAGNEVVVPEIADYEVRRELLRGGKVASVRRLDLIRNTPGFHYQPITSEAMLLAATFWASARAMGKPTADPSALDCDVILAAHAELLRRAGGDAIVATTNMRHLSLFVPAALWHDIAP